MSRSTLISNCVFTLKANPGLQVRSITLVEFLFNCQTDIIVHHASYIITISNFNIAAIVTDVGFRHLRNPLRFYIDHYGLKYIWPESQKPIESNSIFDYINQKTGNMLLLMLLHYVRLYVRWS